MQFPAERNAGCSIGFECLISIGLHGGAYVRTYVRKWRHNLTKISGIEALLEFVTLGASRAFCAEHRYEQLQAVIFLPDG